MTRYPARCLPLLLALTLHAEGPSPHRLYVCGMESKGYVVGAKLPPSGLFLSGLQTGTGSQQSFAHGLGVTPTRVAVFDMDDSPATAGVFTCTEGTHDATNVNVTVTSGKKFKVIAFP